MFDHRSRRSSMTLQLTGVARCGRSGESPGGAELELRAADLISDVQISPSKLNIRHQAHPLLPTYTTCCRLIKSQARPPLIRHYKPRIRAPHTTQSNHKLVCQWPQWPPNRHHRAPARTRRRQSDSRCPHATRYPCPHRKRRKYERYSTKGYEATADQR